MGQYVLKRLGQALFSLFVISVFVFLLVRLTGDPTQVLLPTDASPEQYQQLKKELGLDQPLLQQYVTWAGKMLRGDLGTSASRRVPVAQLIQERLPASLELAAAGLAVSLLIGIPLGVYSAAWRGSAFDGLARTFAFLGQSMPAFWLGIILIMVFAVHLKVLPAGGRGDIASLILPGFTMGWFTTAGLLRITRSSMLEVLNNDYIKLARIKGLRESVVLWKHALKNAALPVLTFAGLILFIFVSGAIITETVFSWPGVGTLVLQATLDRDFSVVQGVVLLIASLYLFGNLLIDLLYSFLNPRIRYG